MPLNAEGQHIVYDIEHTNPDTDSVCSAIAYAHFKNLTGKRYLFTPARVGRINEETRFVPERCGVPVPNEIETLVATVSDLEIKKPVFIHTHDSVQALALLMRKNNVRSVPVVDESRRLAGMVGLKDVAQHYMDSVGFSDLKLDAIGIDILVRTLNCRVIGNSRKVDKLTGRIFTATMQKGTILNKVRPGDIVIIGDQHDIQMDLIHAGCSALIVVENLPLGNDIVSAAEEKGTLLLSLPHNAFATLQFITMSVPVETIM